MSPPSLRGALDDPPVPSATPQPAPRRPRRSWRQRAVFATGIVVVFGILGAVAAVGYSEWRFSQLHKEKLKLAKPVSGVPQNYLIVGSDSRSVIAKNDPNKALFEGGTDATGGQRSDTIMVVRIDPAKKTAKLLSFPRDLWVPIWGTGASQRINTAYNNGPQPLINTIEQDFGIPINHYVEVNFDSFRDVVNAIGGVPLYFSTRMRDKNSGLDIETPGCVTLNGDQALSFARSRELQYYDTKVGYWKYDGTGDLGRITRQQIFIRTLVGRAEGKLTGLNLITTNNLVHSVVKNLKVDSSFSAGRHARPAGRLQVLRRQEAPDLHPAHVPPRDRRRRRRPASAGHRRPAHVRRLPPQQPAVDQGEAQPGHPDGARTAAAYSVRPPARRPP